MIEWVVSNTAISRYFHLKHLPEGNVQSDHNVVGHTDQTGCPTSAPVLRYQNPFHSHIDVLYGNPITLCYATNPSHASKFYVLLYTEEGFSLKTRNVPSSCVTNPTAKTGINEEKTNMSSLCKANPSAGGHRSGRHRQAKLPCTALPKKQTISIIIING